MSDTVETNESSPVFDFEAYPPDTFFHERREGKDRRDKKALAATDKPPQRRTRPERRRKIDPTTFEKQYSPDELEFMNAMQQFKTRTGKAFPTYGEVLQVALQLGYSRLADEAAIMVPSFDLVGP